MSLAGARRGLRDGTRSGLWSEYAKAIDILRPKVVVIENVRGLLSAQTIEEVEDAPDSDMEPGQGGVGEPPWGDRPVLNAFGRVLGDLAELGYDAEWVGLRAADAGAPHNRYRVFVVAHPYGSGSRWRASQSGTAQRHHAALGSGERAVDPSAIQDANLPTGDQRRLATPGQEESGRTRTHVGGRGGASTTDTRGNEPERWGGASDLGSTAGASEADGEEWQRIWDAASYSGPVAADSSGIRGDEGNGATGLGGESTDRASVANERGARSGGTEWGVYQPAIRRWEEVTGRTAPPPTNPDGKNGSHRLSPEFVNWMMGWPAGWVTDPAIGLTRNEQLKACGNGVVSQQCYLALETMAARHVLT